MKAPLFLLLVLLGNASFSQIIISEGAVSIDLNSFPSGQYVPHVFLEKETFRQMIILAK
jgi:hypothetical protein